MTRSPAIHSQQPRRQAGVLAQQTGGETVLLRLDDGGYYAVDEVGARIWELCDGTRAVAAIVDALCAEFDAPRATVELDVLDFIGDLRRERLLIVDDA